MSNEVLLFLHIGSAFMLVSAAAVNMTLTLMLKRSKNTQSIAMLMGLRMRTTLMGLVGAILSSVFGSILAGKLGVEDAGWVTASHITWTVVIVLILIGLFAGFGARKVVKAELAAGRMESQAAADAVNKPLLMMPVMLVNASILLFLYLMTIKPGA
ncbi:MAG: hypothetical protein EXR59_02905 [Dehalococcoidia bacterium]|nr:hypothetical protein [Dehalococcoidia bacterium]